MLSANLKTTMTELEKLDNPIDRDYTCNTYIYSYMYMTRTLGDFQITMVEAVCLCMIKKTVSKGVQDHFVELLQRNAYMYIYFMVVIPLA